MGIVAIDLDGTMVDTVPDFHVAINAMRAHYGLSALAPEVIKDFVGKGSEHLVRSCLAVDMDPANLDTVLPGALEQYQLAYAGANGTLSHVYPGVQEGLARLEHGGWSLACVTNKPRGFAIDLLRMKDLLPYFELVLGGDSVNRKKPDPEAFQAVCRHYGIDAADLTVIGDSSNDAQAARAAGCVSVLVTYGYNHGADVRSLDADAIVDSLIEAAAWIERRHATLNPLDEPR